jgi:Na+/glutamate symporter
LFLPARFFLLRKMATKIAAIMALTIAAYAISAGNPVPRKPLPEFVCGLLVGVVVGSCVGEAAGWVGVYVGESEVVGVRVGEGEFEGGGV